MEHSSTSCYEVKSCLTIPEITQGEGKKGTKRSTYRTLPLVWIHFRTSHYVASTMLRPRVSRARARGAVVSSVPPMEDSFRRGERVGAGSWVR